MHNTHLHIYIYINRVSTILLSRPHATVAWYLQVYTYVCTYTYTLPHNTYVYTGYPPFYSKDLTQYTYICTHILIHTYIVFVSIHMHIYIYTYAYTYVYTGYPPFYSEDRMQLYQTILSGKIEFPRHFKKEARDLISRLLTADL